MKTAILVCAYNEDEVIISVINSILNTSPLSIIIVNDGSTDDTESILVELHSNNKVYFLHHLVNCGKGAAIKTGFAFAKKMKIDNLITFDADGQHDPQDITHILDKLEENYTFVNGSRFFASGNQVPTLKYFANFFANILAKFLYGVRLTDTQSGLRGYNVASFPTLDLCGDDYQLETQVLTSINYQKFCEVPIKVKYTSYSLSKNRRMNLDMMIKNAWHIIWGAI